jgi:hypothetical protein
VEPNGWLFGEMDKEMRLLHTERKWDGIPETSFTADGQENGTITVEDTAYFKVKMYVIVKSDAYQPVRYQIQRVLSRTEMILGLTPQEYTEKKKKDPKTVRTVDVTRFTVADNATIEAPEQARPNIPHEDYERAVYEEEPVMAKRIVPVNEYGQINSPDNPLYTQLSDGSINIGTVNAELEVQLSHKDNDPDAGDVHDSLRIGGTQYEAEVTADNRLQVTNTLTLEQRLKEAIMCSDDAELDFTWDEIDGVRRIVQIIYSSDSVATLLGQSEAKVQRDFTYQGSDPFDLIKRIDQLILVA